MFPVHFIHILLFLIISISINLPKMSYYSNELSAVLSVFAVFCNTLGLYFYATVPLIRARKLSIIPLGLSFILNLIMMISGRNGSVVIFGIINMILLLVVLVDPFVDLKLLYEFLKDDDLVPACQSQNANHHQTADQDQSKNTTGVQTAPPEQSTSVDVPKTSRRD